MRVYNNNLSKVSTKAEDKAPSEHIYLSARYLRITDKNLSRVSTKAEEKAPSKCIYLSARYLRIVDKNLSRVSTNAEEKTPSECIYLNARYLEGNCSDSDYLDGEYFDLDERMESLKAFAGLENLSQDFPYDTTDTIYQKKSLVHGHSFFTKMRCRMGRLKDEINKLKGTIFFQRVKRQLDAKLHNSWLALGHLEAGKTKTKVAEMFQIKFPTLRGWLVRFLAEGVDGFRDKKGI